MLEFFQYATLVCFFVYLFKDAIITKPFRSRLFGAATSLQFSDLWFFRWLGLKAEQLMECAFCLAFWATLFSYLVGWRYFDEATPFWYIWATPVVCKAFDGLTKK